MFKNSFYLDEYGIPIETDSDYIVDENIKINIHEITFEERKCVRFKLDHEHTVQQIFITLKTKFKNFEFPLMNFYPENNPELGYQICLSDICQIFGENFELTVEYEDFNNER